jgi:hypothetical protein
MGTISRTPLRWSVQLLELRKMERTLADQRDYAKAEQVGTCQGLGLPFRVTRWQGHPCQHTSRQRTRSATAACRAPAARAAHCPHHETQHACTAATCRVWLCVWGVLP